MNRSIAASKLIMFLRSTAESSRVKIRRGLLSRPTFLLVSLLISARASDTALACVEECDDNANVYFGRDGGFFDTTAFNNTGLGDQVLLVHNFESDNTAIGSSAMRGTIGFGVDANENTAIGAFALQSITLGDNNTATGAFALQTLTLGNNNTATGAFSIYSNSEGSDNTATGLNSLFSNTTGSYNTADGSAALATNTTGVWNTATGWAALNQNNTGNNNTANGLQALLSNTTGSDNTACGLNALFANTTGSNNIGLGSGAGGNLTTGSNNIDVGNGGFSGESAKIRVGTKGTHKNTYIAGIYGVTVPRGLAVIVDSSGHLGTTTSSARFKEAIKSMDKASEAILSLQPVTFRYKQELDPDGIPQFGLVAEEVAKVNPDLVARDDEGKPYAVRYEAVNAMLLNEFLKEHRKVEEQDRRIREQKATIARLESRVATQEAITAQERKRMEAITARLEEQGSQIQKVSAQLGTDKPAPRLVVDNK